MKPTLFASFIIACCTIAAQAEKVALVGGTAINPGTSRVMPDAVLVIDGDHIADLGDRKTTSIPKGAKTIDCKGKFILPGYIDTHVHFFQSGDIYTRPDAVDLNSVRPYKDEVAMVKSQPAEIHLRVTFVAASPASSMSAVRSGTSRCARLPTRPRKLRASRSAGPLISSVSRPQLDLGDPPIVKINTPEQGRELVRKLAIKSPTTSRSGMSCPRRPPRQSRSKDVERAAIFRPTVHAVVEESHASTCGWRCTRLSSKPHATSVEEGAELLVHSVTDKLVDDAFVKLLKRKGTILTPTLVVFERYGRTFADRLEFTPERKSWGNPEIIASLDVSKFRPKSPRSHQNRARGSEARARPIAKHTTSRSRI